MVALAREGSGDVTAPLRPLPVDRPRIWPIERTVNNVRNDGPELLVPSSHPGRAPAQLDQRHVAAADVPEARRGKGAPPIPNPTKPYRTLVQRQVKAESALGQFRQSPPPECLKVRG